MATAKSNLPKGSGRRRIIAATPGSDRVVGFEDWLPTILEQIGGTNTPKDIDGISFTPILRGKRQTERPFRYREFPGLRWAAVGHRRQLEGGSVLI